MWACKKCAAWLLKAIMTIFVFVLSYSIFKVTLTQVIGLTTHNLAVQLQRQLQTSSRK